MVDAAGMLLVPEGKMRPAAIYVLPLQLLVPVRTRSPPPVLVRPPLPFPVSGAAIVIELRPSC